MLAYTLCLVLVAASSAVGMSVRRGEYRGQVPALDLKDAYMQLRDAFRGASIKIHLYDDNNNVEEQDPDDYYYPPSWNYPAKPIGPPYPISYPYPTAETPTEPPSETSSKIPRRRLVSHLFLPNNIFSVSET